MKDDPQRLAFIDALRGFAILGVILVHCQFAVTPASAWLQTLMAAGARGVQLFYVASALSLRLSWQVRSAREQNPIRNFYIRRLFRVVPMFYLAIAGYLALYGLAPNYYAPNGIRWFYVPLTALFINGFHPETLTSVVPGGWSIVVEMTFYLVFPFLVRRFRSLTALAGLFVASVFGAELSAHLAYRVFASSYPPPQIYLVDALASLNFFSQFPVFVAGMIAHWFFERPDTWKRGAIGGVALLAAFVTAFLLLEHAPPSRLLSMPIVMGAGFAIGSLCLGYKPPGMLVNPVTTRIGTLSFSMYLIHFVIIDLFTRLGVSRQFPGGDVSAMLHYLLVVAVTAAVSSISYRVIESPMIAAGRRVVAGMEGKATVAIA